VDNLEDVSIFTYLNYKQIYCFTDASRFKLNFFSFNINGISIRDYLAGTFPGLNVDEAIQNMKDSILQSIQAEDINGNNPIMKRDTLLTQHLYSTPSMTGFPYGTSICSKLFKALQTNYPDKVSTCPVVTPLLEPGDELVFRGQFVYNNNTYTINFSIMIV
jgi:hypothetical protein